MAVASKLEARRFAIEIVAQSGQIVGSNIDMSLAQSIENSFIAITDLPETAKTDVIQTKAGAMQSAYEALVIASQVSGIAVSSTNAVTIATFIIGNAQLT